MLAYAGVQKQPYKIKITRVSGCSIKSHAYVPRLVREIQRSSSKARFLDAANKSRHVGGGIVLQPDTQEKSGSGAILGVSHNTIPHVVNQGDQPN